MRQALSILLLPFAAGIATAQQTPGTPTAPACSSAPTTTAPTQTRTRTLYAVAELGYEAPDTARLYASTLLGEFGDQFRFPPRVGFMAWAEADTGNSKEAILALAAEAMVVISPDNSVRGIVMSQTSLIPAVDIEIWRALRTAVQSGKVPPPSTLGIKRDLAMYVSLTLEPALLSKPIPGEEPTWDRPKPLARRRIEYPLLTLESPTATFSALPRLDEKSSKLRYPKELGQARRGGGVRLQYVVGQDGRVVPGTIRVVGATERGFAEEAIRSLTRARFFPGEIGGCPVPVLMMHDLAFRIG